MENVSTKLQKAIQIIDEKNSDDPNKEIYKDKEYPKEVLYSQRMTEWLNKFIKDPSDELQIAVRAQHIMRWTSPRDDYPMDRTGYLQWRKDLYKFHADTTSEILKEVGYKDEFISKVYSIVSKDRIKLYADAQVLEDVACLVFLEYYLTDFVQKHNNEKVVNIIKKTLKKMSPKGREAALTIHYADSLKPLINKAIS